MGQLCYDLLLPYLRLDATTISGAPLSSLSLEDLALFVGFQGRSQAMASSPADPFARQQFCCSPLSSRDCLRFWPSGAMWDDLFFVRGVPLLDPLWTDVMDAVRERDALPQVSARGLAELTGAPVGKLAKIIHELPIQGNLISF
jgi:hypothetical protein